MKGVQALVVNILCKKITKQKKPTKTCFNIRDIIRVYGTAYLSVQCLYNYLPFHVV